MKPIFPNIKKLEKRAREGTPKYKFHTGVDQEAIETFEKAYGIVLPESYRQFMTKLNGGMILEEPESFYIDMTEWEPDGPKWSSFYFYALDELIEEYIDLKSENGMHGDDYKGVFSIIPICNTPRQETIMLVSQKGLSIESPVFISDDISDMNTYVQIDDDFDTFIGKLIEYDGFPDIRRAPENQLLASFIYDNKLFDRDVEEETSDEIIARTTLLIKLKPNNPWNYNERGTAYRYNGRRKQALADFNKSVALSDEEPFFYYCRGLLILDYGSKRKALVDLDIAVKLDPKSKLFIIGRADALQKLGKLDKALADCNKVLNKDGINRLALYVRERVYRAMGKDKLARADSDLIDDLNR